MSLELCDGRQVDLVRSRDGLHLIDVATDRGVICDHPRPARRTFREVREDLETDVGRPFTPEEAERLRALYDELVA